MMKLHMQFEPYTRKLKFFSRGISLSKNHPTMTKFELDLHNPMMHPYTKFELNVCNRSRDHNARESNLWNDGMTKGNTICPPAISWRGHNNCNSILEQCDLGKIICLLSLTCCFSPFVVVIILDPLLSLCGCSFNDKIKTMKQASK
jgi:hypothetical protein